MKDLELPKKYEISENEDFFPLTIQMNYKKTGIIYTMIFFLLAHATLITSYLPPTITAISSLYQKNYTNTLPTNLPYHCWMPFQYYTPGTYLIALGYQSIPMFSYAYR